jgi:hypothetical protein
MVGVSLLGIGRGLGFISKLNRGRHTFAAHLVKHGLGDILAALI